MNLTPISHEDQLDQVLGRDQDLLLAFVVDRSQGSTAARQALESVLASHPDARIYAVDARSVRNAAARFHVTAVPTVVRVRDGKTLDRIVGPQPPATYAALLDPAPRVRSDSSRMASRQPSVKIYVTNSCPWCRRLEAYLDQRGVRYSKVNVDNDRAAAQTMVQKSGQMGVPQAEIGGQMVVGFDKVRIDRLLNLPRV